MKRILITGANSYIGDSFAEYMKQFGGEYSVDIVDMIGGSWREKSFAGYDTVFHVAGIAHRKETKENASLYYQVNRDLAAETAEKAKADGVKLFIYLSTMNVYGMNTGMITEETELHPNNSYGKSKLEAEGLLNGLADEHFRVAVLRPPMVYGKGCKGNYTKLAALAEKSPVFPSLRNRRSLIYIDNLSAFVKEVADRACGGLYLPQNKEYVCTSDMVRLIAECHGHKIHMLGLLNPAVKLLIKLRVGAVCKAFGDLCYCGQNTQFVDHCPFEASVKETERTDDAGK